MKHLGGTATPGSDGTFPMAMDGWERRFLIRKVARELRIMRMLLFCSVCTRIQAVSSLFTVVY